MQDPSMNPQFPEQEHLNCPRCNSSNTKFCYYNNYNLSQPRHFCKNCKRYWTKGGTLRNIPVGGGTRKNHRTKRSSNPKRSTPNSTSQDAHDHPKQEPPSASRSEFSQDRSVVDMGGIFSSLLEGNGQFGNMLDGMNNSNGSPSLQLGEFVENQNSGSGSSLIMRNPGVEIGSSKKNSESFLGDENGGDSSCWSGGANGWPDLAINAPGSSLL